MRVLIASKFLHHVGGVETYVRWLANSLAAAGHEVGMLGMEPPEGESFMELPDGPRWITPTRSFAKGASDRAQSALMSVWSPPAGATMKRALQEFQPDLVHFHGTCYQLTPAVVQAVTSAGVPSVLTAHEFKLICASQTLFDDNRRQICTACVGKSPVGKMIAPMRRSCMKGSAAVTALGAIEGRVADHAWTKADPRILAPSQFMRRQLVADGWPSDRIDYLDLPWRPEDRLPVTDAAPGTRRNVIFLGRLAPEKGADLLLRAWDKVAAAHPESRLRLLGDGSERESLEAMVAASSIPRVDFLGRCDSDQVEQELRSAIVTVHPARWHENSPFSVRESLMAGAPALVADLGGMPEMVGSDSGWAVPAEDLDTLVRTLENALTAGLAGTARMADAVAVRAMTETAHLDALTAVYRQEVDRMSRSAQPDEENGH